MSVYDETMGRHVLQPHVPLRDSIIYSLQQAFYSNDVDDAERSSDEVCSFDIVPHWITTNAFTADCLATSILHAWNDWHSSKTAKVSQTQPLYIIELGAGNGKLANSLLRTLVRRFRASGIALAPGQRPPIKYILTDISAKNIQMWKNNAALQPLIEAGYLDMAVFDMCNSMAGKELTLRLEISGCVLSPTAINGCFPITVLANYVLDSIPSDVFRVTHSTLNEAGDALVRLQVGTLSVGSKRAEVSAHDPKIISRMDNNWQFSDVVAIKVPQISAPMASSADRDEENVASLDKVGMSAPRIVNYFQSQLLSGSDSPSQLDRMLEWYLFRGCEQSVAQAYALREAGLTDFSVEEPGMPRPDRALLAYPLHAARSAVVLECEPSIPDAPDMDAISNTFTVPTVGITCLDALRRMTTGSGGPGFLAIFGDKGYWHPSIYMGASTPDFNVHGSFSMMVNFHAVGLWAHSVGSRFWVTQQDDTNLKVCAVGCFPSQLETDMPLFSDTFEHSLAAFGPAEFHDLHAVLSSVGFADFANKAATGGASEDAMSAGDAIVCSDSDDDNADVVHAADALTPHTTSNSLANDILEVHSKARIPVPITLKLRSLVAICKLARWDPSIVMAFRDVFRERISSLTSPRRFEILEGLRRSYLHWLPSREPGADIPFCIAKLHACCGETAAAAAWLLASIRHCGPSVAAAYNLGELCAKRGNVAMASMWFAEVLRLSGGSHHAAEAWIRRLEEPAPPETRLSSIHNVKLWP